MPDAGRLDEQPSCTSPAVEHSARVTRGKSVLTHRRRPIESQTSLQIGWRNRAHLGTSRSINDQPQPSLRTRFRRVWPLLVTGFGLLVTVAWTGLLGWLLFEAVLRLVRLI